MDRGFVVSTVVIKGLQHWVTEQIRGALGMEIVLALRAFWRWDVNTFEPCAGGCRESHVYGRALDVVGEFRLSGSDFGVRGGSGISRNRLEAVLFGL